jgi:sialic acid synthase SpsE
MVKFIAEVSSNHHQDIRRCLEFIDVATEIGCDAVKFQLFKLDELFAQEAINARPEFNERRKWELPVDFLPELRKRCSNNGIEFSCTPFYSEAVNELFPYVDFYKVASYELLWLNLIEKIAATGKPLLLSTGMAELDEIKKAVECFRASGGTSINLLHCISGYPAPKHECNLSAINTLRKIFQLPIGWSDHSKKPEVILRSISKFEVEYIEFHLDLDGKGDEFKTGHCWLPNEIREVITTARSYEIMDGTGKICAMPSEEFDRQWRADPTDGKRPLLHVRSTL